ncbi:hypothetical protein GJV44_00780 [Candidatus Vallotia cooleyia]|nr:hypothetical protein GJV44_00780 [Candidatus Vallotia cooleyia]
MRALPSSPANPLLLASGERCTDLSSSFGLCFVHDNLYQILQPFF